MRVLHTKTETTRNHKQKYRRILTLSLRLHCKSQLSVLPPSRCPSLQSGVDIRLVQKGSAQLIAGPLGVGGGVQRGETWVGGGGGGECVEGFGSSSSGTRRLTLLPEIWRSRVRWGRATGVLQRNTMSVCPCGCV